MKIDVTLEFYHKTAVYKSPITGGLTLIDVKEVYVMIYPVGESIECDCTVVSTHGIEYRLDDLTFPNKEQKLFKSDIARR